MIRLISANLPSCRPLVRWVEVSKMEYRGKHYTIVQGIGPDAWKWAVHLDERTVKSGTARTRQSAVTTAVWTIDKALAAKKAKPTPPSSPQNKPRK
jgi:hypothetical protein